jgi:hypothetical protein
MSNVRMKSRYDLSNVRRMDCNAGRRSVTTNHHTPPHVRADAVSSILKCLTHLRRDLPGTVDDHLVLQVME